MTNTEKYVKEIVIGNGHELRRDARDNEWYMWIGGVRVNKVSAFQSSMIDAAIVTTMIYMQGKTK